MIPKKNLKRGIDNPRKRNIQQIVCAACVYTEEEIQIVIVCIARLIKNGRLITYDNFELELVAEMDDYEGGTFCEPYFQDEEFPLDFDENPNEPGFLDTVNVLRFFWTIYGHKPEGGVEALIDGEDYKYIKKQYDFLQNLLKNQK